MHRIYTVLPWLLIFIPLIGSAQWQGDTGETTSTQLTQPDLTLPELIYNSTEHFTSIDSANLDGLLKRIGDSRLVLLGEGSHGTAEFYDMRSRITRELIEKKGFNIIAAEADWPDAASINDFIHGTGNAPLFNNQSFSRFATWMWVNQSVSNFAHWLQQYNQSAEDTVSFYGLDLYNLFGSMRAVINYLQHSDPMMATIAHRAYSCLIPAVNDPSHYSRAMQSGRYPGCEKEVQLVLKNLHKKRGLYSPLDAQGFFNAVQNARLVINAERYYRTMYLAGHNLWNQRDQHMFDTLLEIMNYHGKTSKVIIWAHNLHVGDARATDMRIKGDINLAQRVRETFGDSAYLVGFGTDHGTVAAASRWGGEVKVIPLPPSSSDSYEHLFHNVKADNFLLPLRHPAQAITRQKLLNKRRQRAVGVVYDPNTELKKNYAYSSLPRQFDEYIWFDETRALTAINR